MLAIFGTATLVGAVIVFAVFGVPVAVIAVTALAATASLVDIAVVVRRIRVER